MPQLSLGTYHLDRIKYQKQEVLELFKIINKQHKRAKLTFGKDYSSIIKHLKNIVNEFTKFEKEMVQLLSEIDNIRKKVHALAANLGIRAKPIVNLVQLYNFGGPFLSANIQDKTTTASFSSKGVLRLHIKNMLVDPEQAESTIAHEFAHSMQPLVSGYLAMSREHAYHELIHLVNAINEFDGKILYRVWKEYEDFISTFNDARLKHVSFSRSGSGNIFHSAVERGDYKGVYNIVDYLNKVRFMLRVMNQNLKLAKIILLSEHRNFDYSNKIQKDVYSIGKHIVNLLSLINREGMVIESYSISKDVVEGFASVFAYIYSKCYGLPNPDASIPSSYLPAATRAYVLYTRKPKVLTDVFCGLTNNIKNWADIREEISNIQKEFSFKTL